MDLLYVAPVVLPGVAFRKLKTQPASVQKSPYTESPCTSNDIILTSLLTHTTFSAHSKVFKLTMDFTFSIV